MSASSKHLDLNVVDPGTQPDWDEKLIRSGENYSFFHSSAWAEVLRSTYGYSPCYFTAGNEVAFSVLVPMMEIDSILTKKRGVSLPFSDYCDSLFNCDSDRLSVRKYIESYGREAGWRYIEYRGEEEKPESPYALYYAHRLDLEPGSQKLFNATESSVRRAIRKALRERITVEGYHSIHAVREFYRLNRFTRKEHGLPPQPYRFFKQVHRHIIEKKKGLVMIAFLNRNPIAAAVFFHIGDKIIFKYGASDKKWQHLRANNLLMWETIKASAEAGFRTFCFGRTEPENEGLRRFKLGWGAREGLIRYYRYNLRENGFIEKPADDMRFHHRIFRKMPIPLLNLIGNFFYRHMG